MSPPCLSRACSATRPGNESTVSLGVDSLSSRYLHIYTHIYAPEHARDGDGGRGLWPRLRHRHPHRAVRGPGSVVICFLALPSLYICYHLWSWAGSTLLEQILLAWVARCLHWTLMVLSTAGQVLRINDWQSMCKRRRNVRKLSNNTTTNILYAS